VGGIIEIVLGINAEGKSLKDMTEPISSASSAVPPSADAAIPRTA
jgi:hypothetical protein